MSVFEMERTKALQLFESNKFVTEVLLMEREFKVLAINQTNILVPNSIGHLPHMQFMKLLNASQAYWKNVSTETSLQRLQFIAFLRKEELQTFIENQEDQLDHRDIGKDLGYFSFSNYSPGSPFFLPLGAKIVRKLISLLRDEYKKRNYQEVITPQLFNLDLWKISGHYGNYLENLFVLDSSSKHMALKPMNCPGHCLIYKQLVNSYADLPLRLADFGSLHRKEISGSLGGLTRCTKFCCDDAHLFVRPDQIMDEMQACLEFVDHVYSLFGFKLEMVLSTRPEKAIGSNELWETAENSLKKALERVGRSVVINEGDGAFYGPKIDIYLLDARQRKHQCGTVQLDFQLPIRFDLQYQTQEMKEKPQNNNLMSEVFPPDRFADKEFKWTEKPLKKGHDRPVIIHRAIFGSIERFTAILLEHFKGKLPFWISPKQIAIVPVKESNSSYAQNVCADLIDIGISVEVIVGKETLNKKIAKASSEFSLVAIVGDKEEQSGTIFYREKENRKELSRKAFIDYAEEINKPVSLSDLEKVEIRLKRSLFLNGNEISEEDISMMKSLDWSKVKNTELARWRELVMSKI